MEMYVLYRLATVLAAVIDDAVTVCKSQICRDLGDRLKNLGYAYAVLCRYLIGAADVSFGYHKNVNGSLGVYILEGVNVFVLVDLGRGDVSVDYFTKQAIHIFNLSAVR